MPVINNYRGWNKYPVVSVYSDVRVSVALLFLYVSVVGCAGQSAAIEPSQHIRSFQVTNCNLIDALLLLGQQEHIGIGIEYIDAPAFRRRVNLQLHDVTLAEVLNAITRPLGYSWSTVGNVLTITHSGAMVGKQNLLNTRIPRFKVPSMPIEEASCNLRIALYFALNPNSTGIAGDCLFGGLDSRIDNIELKNATVRQILNTVVSQHGNGAWVVQQPSWTMDKDIGYGVWKVLAYDAADGQYSRKLLVRGLGLQ